jgi:hypothetical protein
MRSRKTPLPLERAMRLVLETSSYANQRAIENLNCSTDRANHTGCEPPRLTARQCNLKMSRCGTITQRKTCGDRSAGL